LGVAAGLQLLRREAFFRFGQHRQSGQRLRHHHIGGDAVVPDHAARRGQPFLRGQQQRRPILQRERAEHRAGAEGGLAHQFGAIGVLQRPRHDLRRAGAALVNQHHHRQRDGRALFLHRHGFHLPLGVLLQQHIAAAQEVARRGDALVQQAARIVAQIQDKPGQVLLLDRRQGLVEVTVDAVAELGDAHVGQGGARQLVPGNIVDRDPGAHNRHIARVAGGRGQDGQMHRGARRPQHLADHLVKRLPGGGLALHLHDHVARQQASALGRAAVIGRDNRHAAILHLDFRADTLELARAQGLLLAHLVGRHEAAVAGIAQRIDQAAGGAVGQGLRLDRRPVHVILVDNLQGLVDQIVVEIG
jgi:hypothetical protein